MEKVNYHTHCSLCRHADGQVADYVIEAVKKGVKRLGFSDHMPYPDDKLGFRMQYNEIENYREQIQRAKLDLRSEMVILEGFEGEYIKGKEAYYEKLLGSMKFEYIILGQHFIFNKQEEMCMTGEIKTTDWYVDYVNNIIDAMKTGYFCMIAHPDLIFMNDLKWDINCDRACDLLIDAAVKNDYILEYNANGIRRGEKEFLDGRRLMYPHKKFWEKVKNTGVRVIVGSDCHAPDQVYDDCVDKAYEEVNRLGLNIVTRF